MIIALVFVNMEAASARFCSPRVRRVGGRDRKARDS